MYTYTLPPIYDPDNDRYNISFSGVVPSFITYKEDGNITMRPLEVGIFFLQITMSDEHGLQRQETLKILVK